MTSRKKFFVSGQAALVVLLLTVVVISIGLSLSKEVITDVEISRKQEESARAFSAAEAGVDEVFYQWQSSGTVPSEFEINNGSAQMETVELGAGETGFTFPTMIEDGDFAVVWLTSHDPNTGDIVENPGFFDFGDQLNICWGGQAAVELILFYKETVTGNYQTKRWAYDPLERSGFVVSGGGCRDLANSASIDYADFEGDQIPIFMVVKVFYQEVEVGAEIVAVDNSQFASQGLSVTSTGQVTSSSTEVVSRKISAFQTWDIPPVVFIEPLFSGGTTQ
jgi:hypothetical protein